MHSVTIYLQHVKQTDAYNSIVYKYISHEYIPGIVRLEANVT